MLTWIFDNISTIVICAILAAVAVLIIAHMIKNKRKGGSCCGCSGCAMRSSCCGEEKRKCG